MPRRRQAHNRAHPAALSVFYDELAPVAGDDLVALAASNFHFESLWGLTNPPTPKQKDARARRAAILFLRAYGRHPERWAPIDQVDGAKETA